MLPLLSVRRTPLLAAAGRINAFKSIVRSETKELRELAEAREQKAHKQLKHIDLQLNKLEEGLNALLARPSETRHSWPAAGSHVTKP